jgi:hypothetical protein
MQCISVPGVTVILGVSPDPVAIRAKKRTRLAPPKYSKPVGVVIDVGVPRVEIPRTIKSPAVTPLGAGGEIVPPPLAIVAIVAAPAVWN